MDCPSHKKSCIWDVMNDTLTTYGVCKKTYYKKKLCCQWFVSTTFIYKNVSWFVSLHECCIKLKTNKTIKWKYTVIPSVLLYTRVAYVFARTYQSVQEEHLLIFPYLIEYTSRDDVVMNWDFSKQLRYWFKMSLSSCICSKFNVREFRNCWNRCLP